MVSEVVVVLVEGRDKVVDSVPVVVVQVPGQATVVDSELEEV